MPIFKRQLAIAGDLADHGVRTTLAVANSLDCRHLISGNREDVALLRLVAPHLERRHARLGRRDAAKVDAPATVTVRDCLRHRVRQTARTDIVNQKNWIALAERPAAIDDFLRAPLDLRVATLHGSEVEILLARAAGER